MKNATITFRLTDQEKEALNAEAAEIGMTTSQLVRKIILKYLKEKEND